MKCSVYYNIPCTLIFRYRDCSLVIISVRHDAFFRFRKDSYTCITLIDVCRKTDKQTDRQRDRQTDRQTYTALSSLYLGRENEHICTDLITYLDYTLRAFLWFTILLSQYDAPVIASTARNVVAGYEYSEGVRHG